MTDCVYSEECIHLHKIYILLSIPLYYTYAEYHVQSHHVLLDENKDIKETRDEFSILLAA